jgi:DNA polymerase-3 subunit delta
VSAKKKEPVDNSGYERLRAELTAGELGRIYLFYGEEAYLMQKYLGKVRSLLVGEGFGEFNDHRLDGRDLTVEAIVEAVEAMPMMAQHTLVTVTDWDLFKQDEPTREALIALLRDVPDYCTLIFVYDTIPYQRDGKMKKLTAALKDYVQEVAFREQDKSGLYHWICRHFQANGHTIDPATAELLTFTCGSLMAGLEPEIKKISAYAKQEKITPADIRAVADPVLDAQIFDLANKITDRDDNGAAESLGQLLEMQLSPILLLAAIGKTLRQLYTARVALDGGKDRFWVQKLWNMRSDYPTKLLMAAARRVDHDWCAAAVKNCQKLDRRMKLTSTKDSEQELKMFVMSLAQKV